MEYLDRLFLLQFNSWKSIELKLYDIMPQGNKQPHSDRYC